MEHAAKSVLSTQEQSWMLLAARALQESDRAIMLSVDGAPHQGAFSQTRDGATISAQPMTIVNTGSASIQAVVTAVAASAETLSAGGDGFTIERTYYSLDGAQANITQARQNERFVVVLKAEQQNDWAARVLLTDLLPAGFAIDNPSLVSSASLSNFDWLPETEAAHLEFRDDRFVAAFNRDAGSSASMVVAYVVRAVTPGSYTLPAAQVEDMYRPQFSARTATGMMQVVE